MSTKADNKLLMASLMAFAVRLFPVELASGAMLTGAVLLAHAAGISEETLREGFKVVLEKVRDPSYQSMICLIRPGGPACRCPRCQRYSN